jgi:hypothetical protein
LEAATEKKMEEGRWKMEEKKNQRPYRCAIFDVPPALM